MDSLNLLDLGLMVILAYFFIRSLMKGFVREVIGLVGIGAAVFVSISTYEQLGALLRGFTGVTAGWMDGVAFAVLILAVLFLATYLGAKLGKLMSDGPLSGLDRTLGALVGLVKGVLLCYLALNLLLLLVPVQVPQVMKTSFMAPRIVSAGRFLVSLVPENLATRLQKQAGLLSEQAKTPSKGPKGNQQ